MVEFRAFESEKVGLLLVEDPTHLLGRVLVKISLCHFHLEFHPSLLTLLVRSEDVLYVLLDEKLERFWWDRRSLRSCLFFDSAVRQLRAVRGESLRRPVGMFVHLPHRLVVVRGREGGGEGRVGGGVDFGWWRDVDVGAGVLGG